MPGKRGVSLICALRLAGWDPVDSDPAGSRGDPVGPAVRQ